MRSLFYFLTLCSLFISTNCAYKVVQDKNTNQVLPLPVASPDVPQPKPVSPAWEFDDDIYPDNEYSEPLAKYYIKANRKLYAGYEIIKTFEKSGGKVTLRVNKGTETLLFIEEENLNSYWLRWGLFPFLGKKNSQLVIMRYSGGGHCCTSYQIYDLVPEFKLIFDGDEYDISEIGNDLVPVDIDKDGIYEFTQEVMAFDYFHASHAASVFPRAVFAYSKTTGSYQLASRRFGRYLLRGIDKDLRDATTQIRKYKNIESDAFDDYYYGLTNVVLKYVYAGQEKKGWEYFEKNYKRGDKDELRKDLKGAFEQCPIYQSIYGNSIK